MSFKSSLQRELDSFFKKIKSEDFNIREVTKSAFTQARAKLNPWAFIRLNEVAVDTFYSQAEVYLWKTMRVLAVDGTRLVLPNHKTVKKEFGEHSFGPKADSPRSLALASILYDVLNMICIDARIAPYAYSERKLLGEHLTKLRKGDLLLLDRGYPSIALMFLLKAMGIEFCIRMKDSWWLSVKKFILGAGNEELVKYKLPKKDRKLLADYPEMLDKELTFRLVKIELPTGEKEVLCSSLVDFEEYPYDQFDALYHTRWNEEEGYKLLKSRVEVEDFSGKTALAVKQDFHAKVLLMTLCAAYAHPVEEKVKKEYAADENRKYDQKINRTNALATTIDILVGLFVKKTIKKALNAFDKLVEETREIIRPGRKVARKKRPKRLYYMNYKRL